MVLKEFERGMVAGAAPFAEAFKELDHESAELKNKIKADLATLKGCTDEAILAAREALIKQKYGIDIPLDANEVFEDYERQYTVSTLSKIAKEHYDDAQDLSEAQRIFAASIMKYFGVYDYQDVDLSKNCIRDLDKLEKYLEIVMSFVFLHSFDSNDYKENWVSNLLTASKLNDSVIDSIGKGILFKYNFSGAEGLFNCYKNAVVFLQAKGEEVEDPVEDKPQNSKSDEAPRPETKKESKSLHQVLKEEESLSPIDRAYIWVSANIQGRHEANKIHRNSMKEAKKMGKELAQECKDGDKAIKMGMSLEEYRAYKNQKK